MAIVIKPVTLEVSKPNVFQAIAAKQNDSNSRFLKATIVNEGEKIHVLPTSKVTINAKRSDGESSSFFGEANEDGTATVPLHSWVLEIAGHVNCDVSIIDADSRKLTTTTFSVLVEEASNSSDDISSDEQYDVLTELINTALELGGVPGPPGEKGDKGDPGVGISKVEIISNELVITLTDDTVINLGNVKGEKGDKGDTPEIPAASTSQAGIVKLNDGIASTSKVEAATANAVRTLYLHSDRGSGNNTNSGSCNLARGTKNTITGDKNIVCGAENEVSGGNSLVSGANNVVTAARAIVGGRYNEVAGRDSIVSGSYNKNSYPHTLLLGERLEDGGYEQIVVGIYNEPDDASAIIVARGTSSEKKNVFTVHKEGTPTRPTDAVTLEYLNNTIENAITKVLTTPI